MKEERVYSTGQVAEAARTSIQTVIRCADEGSLEHYKIPGSTYRRILEREVAKFLLENGLPLGEIRNGKPRVMLLSKDDSFIRKLTRLSKKHPSYEIKSCDNTFSAGMIEQDYRADTYIVDFSIGYQKAIRVCRYIKELDSNTEVIAKISSKMEVEKESLQFMDVATSHTNIITSFLVDTVKKFNPHAI